MENYYEELGISPDATQEQIERAYRWLVQKFHPDRNADFQEEAKSRFLRIQRAFDVLSDPIARKQYDEQLRGERQNSSAGAATKKDDGPDQQNNKRKKHPIALSPFWITVLSCIAVLAIAVMMLRNSLEAPASTNNSDKSSDQTVADSADRIPSLTIHKDLDALVNAAHNLPDNNSLEVDLALNNFGDFEFTEEPLNLALNKFHEKYGVQIFVDTPALKTAGIDLKTSLVNVSVKHIPLKTFLELTLGQFNLGYYVRDGILIVTTKDKLLTTWEIRVYNCRTILSADPDQFHKALAEGKDEERAARADRTNKASTSIDRLIDLIITSVNPGSWQRTGGCGSICEYNGLLIVNQICPLQSDVADLLNKANTSISEKLPK